MRAQYPNALIVSAETPKKNRNKELQSYLQSLGVKFKKVTGSYKGHIETSFLVVANDAKIRKQIVDTALDRFEQESVLHQSNEGLIYLVYKNKNERIGYGWKTYDTEPDVDAWTKVDDKYWVAV
jgi:uncharacterized membrane protein